ncbi:hypothetical protein NIES2107_75690 (plasmid) [Nostoc carneum NIES-2107]|nr:hypothetical protein NIES2107_75690 [Nostoc carneum NIES-2107]
MGKALTELRDRRLYCSTHRTFEEYCRDRFSHSRRQSYLLMDAAVVFDNLVEKCDQFDHKLPTRVGNWRLMQGLPAGILPLQVLERTRSLSEVIKVYPEAVTESHSADGAAESGG